MGKRTNLDFGRKSISLLPALSRHDYFPPAGTKAVFPSPSAGVKKKEEEEDKEQVCDGSGGLMWQFESMYTGLTLIPQCALIPHAVHVFGPDAGPSVLSQIAQQQRD